MKKRIIVIYSKPLRLGAQEKDSLAGIELCKIFDSDTIKVEIDFASKKITSNEISLPSLYHFGYFKKVFVIYFKFLLCKLLVWDPALRESIKLNYFKFISYLSLAYPNSIVLTETTNLLPLSLLFKYRVSRSHNFEPLHSYREQKFILLGIFYFLIKIQSIVYERIFADIICISRRDANLYKLIPSRKKIITIPLRDLVLRFRTVPDIDFKNLGNRSVAYLGSSYNVHHNRIGLEFFINEVFSSPHLDQVTLNVYGSKLQKSATKTNIKINGWVEDLDEIYCQSDVFLCSDGGTGQQSKIFEPLSRGKILICKPELLHGHKLIPDIHYLAARNSLEFKKQILRAVEDPLSFNYLRKNAFEYCLIHFSYEKNLLKFKNLLQF